MRKFAEPCLAGAGLYLLAHVALARFMFSILSIKKRLLKIRSSGFCAQAVHAYAGVMRLADVRDVGGYIGILRRLNFARLDPFL